MDDEFYQGIFNFQITIIDFIIRKYAAKRHKQGLSRPRIFTISLLEWRFLELFAMPQSALNAPQSRSTGRQGEIFFTYKRGNKAARTGLTAAAAGAPAQQLLYRTGDG
ncbi:hypothetical protein ACTOWA_20350 [Herbaspirillum seropedicae]|uniref:hypothetical protein n=1 Tax=Herbaspirillum seropedicae TaxID=964 RepID=UPI003F8D5081